MTSPLPAVFRREATSKLVGCLVYAVAGPFVALFLALFLSLPLMLVLENFGMSRERASTPFVVLLPPIGLGVLVWGYRDYQSRAGLAVVIDRDRLEITAGSRRTVVAFADVASIRLVPTRLDLACVLATRSGKAVRIPHEIAPFEAIRGPLEWTLIPEMTRRLDDRIAGGESVDLRTPARRSLAATLRAIGALPLGIFLWLKPSTHRMGAQVVRHAAMLLKAVRQASRGGLILGRDGLRRSSDSSAPPVPWDRLDRIASGEYDLVLRSQEGQLFALTLLADDYWPAARWIEARIK